MDTASFRGRETTTEALGRTWKVSRWSLDRMDDFRDWAATQLPDPLEIAEKALLRHQRQAWQIGNDKSLPDEERAFLLAANQERQERLARLAMEQATGYLSFLSPQVRTLLFDPRGSARLFLTLLREHQPEVTEEQAYQIGEAVGSKEQERIMAVTMGKGAGGGNGEAPAA